MEKQAKSLAQITPQGEHYATSDRRGRRQVPGGRPGYAKEDYRDKSKQATTRDGLPIWRLRLTAFDMSTEHGSSGVHLGRGG